MEIKQITIELTNGDTWTIPGDNVRTVTFARDCMRNVQGEQSYRFPLDSVNLTIEASGDMAEWKRAPQEYHDGH